MENKIKKIIVLVFIVTNIFAQKTKLDTLKMFEGHWVFKMAMNTDYTTQELEDTYLKDVRGGKIHIKGNRIFADFDGHSFVTNKIDSNKMETNGGKYFLDDEFEKSDLSELKKIGIQQQPWMGIYNQVYFPYKSLQLLIKQQYLIIGMDQTMFFLEKDKSEYKFIGAKETPILREYKTQSLNKLLENEEVEILEKGAEYTKIRYWGKALIIGWVKTADLKSTTDNAEYWNIYKNNTIKFHVLATKSLIYDEEQNKTNKYLIKNDIVEVLEEKGYFLKIKFNNVTGLIPRFDVEGYNTFRITKPKSTIHSSVGVPTKMYLIKGDDIELIDREDDWLKIRYYGKKVIEGWIKRSDVE